MSPLGDIFHKRVDVDLMSCNTGLMHEISFGKHVNKSSFALRNLMRPSSIGSGKFVLFFIVQHELSMRWMSIKFSYIIGL